MMTYKTRKEKRRRRHMRARKKIHGTASRPRLSVFTSAKQIYSQIIDDDSAKTLLAATSAGKKGLEAGIKGNLDGAKKLGKAMAEKALASGINAVVFDKGGFKYHGKIKAFADAARETGLKF